MTGEASEIYGLYWPKQNEVLRHIPPTSLRGTVLCFQRQGVRDSFLLSSHSSPPGDQPGLASSIPDSSHLWCFLREAFHGCAGSPPRKIEPSPDRSGFLCSRLRTSEGSASFPEGTEPPCQTANWRGRSGRCKSLSQGQHSGPRKSWKGGQTWQADGRMGRGQGVPHSARIFDLDPSDLS